MLSIILLTALGIFALQFSSVQTYLSQKIAKYLSEELHTGISIEKVYFKPFSSIELKELLLHDRNGDTMLYTQSATANLSLRKFLERKIEIQQLKLEEAFVHYHIYKDSTNFSFLLDYFAPKNQAKTSKSSLKINMNLQRVAFVNNTFKLVNHNFNHHHKGVDFSDLELTKISGVFSGIQYSDEDIFSDIKNLTFQEKSGLLLKELSASAYVSNRKMEFRDLTLRTNRSSISDYLLFEYTSFADFKDFIKKVNIQSTLNNAHVDSRDIEYFAPSMKYVRFEASIPQAMLSGTVEHIEARHTQIKTGENTVLEGNFTIDGLPEIERTRFYFDLDALTSSAKDVEQLVPLLANMRSFSLPKLVHKFKTLHYRGQLDGFYHHFKIDGNTSTDIGSFKTSTDINLRPILQFTGKVESKNFNLGQLLDANLLGQTGFDAQFEGSLAKGKDLKLLANGFLNQFNLKNYRYDHITFNSEIINNMLLADGTVQDAHAQLAFEGEIDWHDTLPSYAFHSTIDHLNLKRTHLYERDSIVIKHSNLETHLAGNTLNSLTGNIQSNHIEFSSTRGNFSMNRFEFESIGDQKSKELTVKSDVVDAIVTGEIDLSTIVPYFRSLAMRYAPAINLKAEPYNPQNFDLRVHIKSFDPVSALFSPDLKLDDGAHLTAAFSTEKYTASFDAFSPIVTYKGMKLTNMSVAENADDRAFSLSVKADRFSLSDSAYIDNIKIDNVLANDSLHFNILLSEENRANYLDLHGNIHFAHNQPAYIRFEKSKIVLNSEDWQVSQDADVQVSKGKFYLHNLLLKRDNQAVNINGILSNEDDQVNIAFTDFSLASFSGITRPLGIRLQGHMNGDLKINSVFKAPNLSAHIRTTPIVYNDLPIGSLTMNADFEPQNGLVRLHSRLRNIDGNGFDLSGTYDLHSTTDALQLKGSVKNTDLVIVQPFLKTLISNLYGKISGEVDISGTVQRPIISGMSTIRDAGFSVNYLQTSYHISNQPALIDKNTIRLANFKLNDSRNSTSTANGYVDLNKLSDPSLDINIAADNFHILNTQLKDNELFYGTAYASGTFRFKGPTSAIDININARSNPNTSITIPFNTALKVSDSDFIYFVNTDTSKNEKEAERRILRGLTMNMDLAITPEAEINLENNIGSLTGSGTGTLSLRISSLGDFEMFGDYHVASGKFHFTAQDFFNKFFDLKQGGTIRWAGNPAEASINLSAAYQQRTSIAPLYNAAGRNENNERILAEADMILKGTLSQPEVSFDLNFPQNPYIKDELQSYLSDANNVNQQAISLIVRRSFTPASTQEFGREVNSTLLSAGTEIAFNQLNSIISQSLNVNFFDLNIRSFNDASASLRFFNDRLVFTGGITDNRNQQINDLTLFTDKIATDAELTYRLRQDGNLVLRAYNRLNPRNFLFTPNSDYISAAGLVYRQEFNSLPEFWRKLWYWRQKKESVSTDSTSTR